VKTFNVTYNFEPKLSPNWQFWNVVMRMIIRKYCDNVPWNYNSDSNEILSPQKFRWILKNLENARMLWIFFLFSKIYEEWNLRLLKLVLNFTAGKNYSTFTNHSKVSVFSSIKKNYGVNRRILIYLSISTWTKQEFLPDFEEIVVTWQSHHIQNRSGIYLNAFL
jgi:hypothetical protein